MAQVLAALVSPLVSVVNGVLDAAVPKVAQSVLSRLDLTGIVIDRVDFARVIDSALDSIDLTTVVLDRVDLDAIVRRVDLDEVLDRAPLVAIAEYLIEEIDLPRLIRESTGGVAVDAIDAVRMGSHGVDAALATWMDRAWPGRRGGADRR